MFQRVFTTGVLNLEPDESCFVMDLGSLRLNLLLATMFQRMFTSGILNLHCKESHFDNVPWITEADPLSGHHVQEDVHNRDVEPSL